MSSLDWGGRPVVHPLHAILLSFPVALFASALAFDIAYLKTAVLQWSNFSAWLIAVALLLGAPVVAWAAVRVIFRRAGRGQALIYFLLLAVMWLSGLVNAFKHSQDGWSSVGGLGVTLSVVSTLAALAAAWVGHSDRPMREVVQ